MLFLRHGTKRGTGLAYGLGVALPRNLRVNVPAPYRVLYQPVLGRIVLLFWYDRLQCAVLWKSVLDESFIGFRVVSD